MLNVAAIFIAIILYSAFAVSTDSNIAKTPAPQEGKTVKIVQITKSRILSTLYVVTIQVCAANTKIYSPELVIKSDLDTINVKLVGLIMPDSCLSRDFFIRANNPSSITVNFR